MTAFAPDPMLAVEVVASPNHDARRGVTGPDMLILHYTGMSDSAEALVRLCSPQSRVSAHYVVFEDGRLVQCVAESRRAWHAGTSAWNDATDINSHSIGIEIANPGHDFGYPDFPPGQIQTVTALCRDILARHGIPADRVLAHSDVAPSRKQDPGEKFPWPLLAADGIGHWVEPAPPGADGDVLLPGNTGAGVAALQRALRRYGYPIEVTSRYDEATVQVVRAFQRHFRPARVDGVADASTRQTLEALLASRPAIAVV